ncbi:GNAT family protein [Ectobacillus antri]|jgi:ribosomal-protein-serine acetyltransferase|uniref:GNAT family protein n=1 Tax=Ectobacillus antri TaxID=2486280 RepID=A0ABT6H757_9BACI|nr:GNAT family protein [Ectobacillus antri]MDG4656802.1 GNAT family protein [Ectobacillus antri]MDG5754301.1 GNAT family protein [Ectobacillus antri]
MFFAFQVDEDITLRLLDMSQADLIFKASNTSREHLRRWLPWVDDTHTLEDTKKFIQATMDQFAQHKGFCTSIWWRDEFAGIIDFHGLHTTLNKIEIGYWLLEKHQGRGIMTKACRAFVDHAFSVMKLERVEILAAVGNTKSQAIPKRLGFKQEGVLRKCTKTSEGLEDVVIFGLLKDEWTKQEH